jgi:hypothetical protein
VLASKGLFGWTHHLGSDGVLAGSRGADSRLKGSLHSVHLEAQEKKFCVEAAQPMGNSAVGPRISGEEKGFGFGIGGKERRGWRCSKRGCRGLA